MTDRQCLRCGDPLQSSSAISNYCMSCQMRLASSIDTERAARLAAEARVTVLKEALREAEDILAMVAQTPLRDPLYHDAVKELGKQIGFGALMSCATRAWAECLAEDGHPAGMEFVAGPCRGTVERTLKILRAALKGGSNG